MSTRLTSAIKGLNSVIRDVRGYISGATAETIGGPGLRSQLIKVVTAISEAGGMRIQMDVDAAAARQIPRSTAQHVLHIAREALSNCVQHSQGRWGLLSLQRVKEGVRLVISDDGVGFILKKRRKQGLGITNMQARVQQMNAKLQVLSQPGCGVRIVVTIPSKRKSHGSA